MASIDEEWAPDPRSNRRSSIVLMEDAVRTPTGRGKRHPSSCRASTFSRSPGTDAVSLDALQVALYIPGEPLTCCSLFVLMPTEKSSDECAEGGIDQSRKLGAGFGDRGGRGDQDLRRRRTSRVAGNARRKFISGR